mmetsp:Transcript_3436/g.9202  ORF Transcript_3436/g.9202 Transcript_3436/m.9202 type:complete len:291 (-) Transcript_3436:271-1143(-)
MRDETRHESPKSAFCTTSLAISPETCVKRGTPAAQSPRAYTSGLVVTARSSILTPDFGSKATPAASSPMPSTLGTRPAATSSVSHSSSDAPLTPTPLRVTRRRGSVPSPSAGARRVSTLLGSTPRRNVTPAFSSVLRTASTAAGSSRAMIFDRTRTVTAEPNDANAWAISIATTPAPRMTIRGGRVVRLNSVSLVTYGAAARPTIDAGTTARPPVAITAFLNFSRCPLTSTSRGPTKRPRPWKTSAPAPAVPSCESAGAMRARRARMRAITAPKLTENAAGADEPSGASR